MNNTSNFTRFEGFILEKLSSFEYILLVNDTNNTKIKIKIPNNTSPELNTGQFISCLGHVRNEHAENMNLHIYFEVNFVVGQPESIHI